MIPQGGGAPQAARSPAPRDFAHLRGRSGRSAVVRAPAADGVSARAGAEGDVTHTTESNPKPARPPGPRVAEACGYCGGAVALVLSAPAPDRPSGPVYDHVECAECGALALVGARDAGEAGDRGEVSEAAAGDARDEASDYGPDYYTARQRTPGPARRSVRALRRLRARLLLGLRSGRLARALSGRRYGRFEWFRRTGTGLDDPILDVGCGSGRLLFRLHAEGFGRLVGLDPHLPPAAAARAVGLSGLRLERGPLAGHRGRYRLVMAHHSFEHLPDPRASFAALAALVAPGGCLLLRVPLADSFARRHYGARWAQLDPPRHLHLPTRASLARLAAAEGLELFHVEDDSGVFQILGSERARPGGGPARRVRALLRGIAARRTAARLRREGRGDQAAFYLRRPT